MTVYWVTRILCLPLSVVLILPPAPQNPLITARCCDSACWSVCAPCATLTFTLPRCRRIYSKYEDCCHTRILILSIRDFPSLCFVKNCWRGGWRQCEWMSNQMNEYKGLPWGLSHLFFPWQRPLGVPALCSWAVYPRLFDNVLVQSDIASYFLYVSNQMQTIRIAQLNSEPTGNCSSKALLLS